MESAWNVWVWLSGGEQETGVASDGGWNLWV